MSKKTDADRLRIRENKALRKGQAKCVVCGATATRRLDNKLVCQKHGRTW